MKIERKILLNPGPATTTDSVKWHKLFRIFVLARKNSQV